MSSIDDDRRAILKLHRDWWHANEQWDIPLMTTCFPVGPNYLMFNFNWHPYFGIDEKIQLWEYYKASGLQLEPLDVRIMKFEVIGDLAYIANEFEIRTKMPEGAHGHIDEVQALPPPGETFTDRGRATEVYKRDDGEGRPIWKMWHFHCSPLPPVDTIRPGFNDTAQSRGGLGWNPWGKPLSLVDSGRD
jgi:hypothetical protein